VNITSRRHFFDQDSRTLEDILEGRKLMDAERKRVFAISLNWEINDDRHQTELGGGRRFRRQLAD